MLQILWEKGFIDPGKLIKLDCTLNGKKDARGDVIIKTSLKHLRSLQTHFIEEETLLDIMGDHLGSRLRMFQSAILRLLVRRSSMIGVAPRVCVAVHPRMQRNQKKLL
jgi:hypothetical protein